MNLYNRAKSWSVMIVAPLPAAAPLWGTNFDSAIFETVAQKLRIVCDFKSFQRVRMRIQVRLFAVLRDAAGAGQLELVLPAMATVAAVAAPLAERYPALTRHLHRVAYAVNREYASENTPLHDGDEVALIPPVSGG